MDLEERLMVIHRKALAALRPLTFMITRRRFSPTAVQEVIGGLQEAVDDMQSLVTEQQNSSNIRAKSQQEMTDENTIQ